MTLFRIPLAKLNNVVVFDARDGWFQGFSLPLTLMLDGSLLLRLHTLFLEDSARVCDAFLALWVDHWGHFARIDRVLQ